MEKQSAAKVSAKARGSTIGGNCSSADFEQMGGIVTNMLPRFLAHAEELPAECSLQQTVSLASMTVNYEAVAACMGKLSDISGGCVKCTTDFFEKTAGRSPVDTKNCLPACSGLVTCNGEVCNEYVKTCGQCLQRPAAEFGQCSLGKNAETLEAKLDKFTNALAGVVLELTPA